jgi:hypothetical protein
MFCKILMKLLFKGAFTLANFARDFALSLHILLNKNYLFSLLNVQASAKSRMKLCQFKRTFMFNEENIEDRISGHCSSQM